MRLVIVALLTLLLAACSEPRIDASSTATLDASIERVREALPADQRGGFDALVAQARADDAAADPPISATSPSPAFASINGMTGAEAIDALRQRAERRAAERAAAEQARLAEVAARESRELAALEATARAHAASLGRLRAIEVTDLRPEIRKAGLRRSHAITATIRNTLDAPLARIDFDFSVRTPGRATPLSTGSGQFAIRDALQPGESRKLDATAEGTSDPFAAAVKAMDQDRTAVLAVTITGATTADGKPVLVPGLEKAQENRLGRLRARASETTANR